MKDGPHISFGCDTRGIGRQTVILLRQSSTAWQRGSDEEIIMELIKYSHELSLIPSTSRSCPQGVSGFPAALGTVSARRSLARVTLGPEGERVVNSSTHEGPLNVKHRCHLRPKGEEKHIGGCFVVFSRTQYPAGCFIRVVGDFMIRMTERT